MPFYKFLCLECEHSFKVLLQLEKLQDYAGSCPKCWGPIKRILGVPLSRSVETADEYRGKKVESDLQRMIDDRAQHHFKTHELPRLIAEEGIEYAKAKGFVDADGRPR